MENKVISALASLMLLSACAGDSLEGNFAPDPQLQTSPTIATSPTPTASVTLPITFPLEIPLYPEAELTKVENDGQISYWKSSNSTDKVKEYYRQQLSSNNWKISPDNAQPNILVADRSNLQLTLSFLPPQSGSLGTEYTLSYQTQVSSSPTPSAATPQPKAANEPVQTYIKDLVALGAIQTPSNPNSAISRRQYARWLFTANNQILADNPTQQIRAAATDIQPAFKDVPKSDRDFPVIQGLAEAGIIPSSLSGDATATLFRPDTPLTRENLLLWKVPLDTRQPLPKASVEAVKETWGFQDAGKIAPEAAKAVLADFQNGAQANIKRSFGFTTIFQPKKPVTHAEAAAALWYFGSQGEGRSAQEALEIKKQPPPPSPATPSIPPTPVVIPTAIPTPVVTPSPTPEANPTAEVIPTPVESPAPL